MAKSGQNISILIACILLAVILWGYVTLTRTYEADIDVPLVVSSPPNQALLSTVPATITARVRGSGLEIFNLKYLARTAICELDLSKLRSVSASVFNVEREDIIRAMSMMGSLQILSVTPTAMTLTTGDVFVREIPVRLHSNISTRTGFVIVGEPTIEPPVVTVRGTRSVVESLTQWPTQRLALADLSASTEASIPLSDSLRTLLNFQPGSVKVRINVQQAAEIVIRNVPVRIVSDDASLVAEPSSIHVAVRGGADQLARLRPEDLDASVKATAVGPAKPFIVAPRGVHILNVQPAVIRLRSRAR
jgi:YbbR domain-containing protein